MFRLALVPVLACSAQLTVAADAARGGELYAGRCGACHSITDNGAGPRHAGLIGRKAGSQPGFDYSQALRNSGIIWDARQLDRWLANPNTLVPGNKMAVQLANDRRDRNDIIAFLIKATSPGGRSVKEKSPSAP
jgi:cytochrome c